MIFNKFAIPTVFFLWLLVVAYVEVTTPDLSEERKLLIKKNFCGNRGGVHRFSSSKYLEGTQVVLTCKDGVTLISVYV